MKDSKQFLVQTGEKIKILLPYISASDLLIAGHEELTVGMRYDDENMLAPVIILMEQGLPIDACKEAALNCGTPFIVNDALIKNLFKYGKLGETIPEMCCRDIAAIITRNEKKIKPGNSIGNNQIKKTVPPRIKRPVKLEIGETLSLFLAEEVVLEDGLEKIRKKLSRLFGFAMPEIGIIVNQKIRGGDYRIFFKGVETGRGSLDLSWYRTFDLGIGQKHFHLISRAAAAKVLLHIEDLLQKNVQELLGRDEVQTILDKAEKKYPVVTGEVKSLLSLGSIRDILRSLLSEHVSIRHIQIILETLADWGSYGPAPNGLIIEQIRQSLKRQICFEYADDYNILRVINLDAEVETIFSDRAANRGGNGAISDTLSDEWLDAFSPAIAKMEENGCKPVVICSPAARSWIKEFTRMRYPNLVVLSYMEIPSDINVEFFARISLGKKPRRKRKDSNQ